MPQVLGGHARRAAVAALAALATVLAWAAPALAAGPAPGAPGAPSTWTNADKDGFGTSVGTASKLWYTLERGSLTEVYFPRIDQPNVRTLQFVVSDGHTFADAERGATVHRVRLDDGRALVYTE